MNGYALIRRSTEVSAPAWQGHVGPNREVVRPGESFAGTEGVLGIGVDEIRTGWYEPLEWWPVARVAAAFQEHDWPDGNGPVPDEEYAEMAARYAATPADFPGLAEHYPQIARAYPG